MSSRCELIVFLLLVTAPGVLLMPVPPRAAAQGGSQHQFTGVAPTRGFNYSDITLTSTSVVEYSVKAGAPLETAFMTSSQFLAFRRTGDISYSVFYGNGTEVSNALLEVQGLYYLVVSNTGGQAVPFSGFYAVDSGIELRNSTTSVGLTIGIRPGQLFSIPLHAETLGSPSRVEISGTSSQVVRYSLQEKNTHRLVFESGAVTATNFTVTPTVSLGYNFTLQPGLYTVGIQNESPYTAMVYFSYTIRPEYVNPFLLHLGPPSPTGIVSYGVFNESGKIAPYRVESGSIVGFAEIAQLSAVDNGTNLHLASLQENTVLQVNNTDGTGFTYWPQNVLAFDTAVPATVTYRDNVLNITGDNSQLTNQSITGSGTTGTYNNSGVSQTYYGNYGSKYTYHYTLPQAWVLYTNATVETGVGVVINMGVRALDGPAPETVTWFDAITIHDRRVASAALVVDGRQYTPSGSQAPIGAYYDAELVFGGGAGGTAAYFQISARLALFYQGDVLKPFPSVYTFGDNTAESAYNIEVSYANGSATATSGTPYYGILTNQFNASLPSLTAGASGRPAGTEAYVPYFVGAGVLAAVLVILVLALVASRGRRVRGTVPGVGPEAVGFCGNCGAARDPVALYCSNCGAPLQRYGQDEGAGSPG